MGSFGQKKPAKQKKEGVYYLNAAKSGQGYVGKVEALDVRAEILPTGNCKLSFADDGGPVMMTAKPKDGKYGPSYCFVIDGHFWWGSEGESQKEGKPYFRLARGNVAPPREEKETPADEQPAAEAAPAEPTPKPKRYGRALEAKS